MKAFLPPFLILAAILTAAALNCAVIAQKTTIWHGEILQAETQAQSGDWPAAKKSLQAMRRSWESSRTYLRVTVRHEELDSVEALFVRAAAAAGQGERSDFLGETAELRSQLRLLSETEQFKIGNVF